MGWRRKKRKKETKKRVKRKQNFKKASKLHYIDSPMEITYLKVETGRHLTYIFLTLKEWVVTPDRMCQLSYFHQYKNTSSS